MSSGPEALFHLNPALANEANVPLVHKFEMGKAQKSRLGDQTIYILKQGEEGTKGACKSIIIIRCNTFLLLFRNIICDW